VPKEIAEAQKPPLIAPSVTVATWLRPTEQLLPETRQPITPIFVGSMMVGLAALILGCKYPALTHRVVPFAIASIVTANIAMLLRGFKVQAIDPYAGFPWTPEAERVRMEVLQDGVVTGVDWGYTWIEKGSVYYSGRLTSFAIPKSMIAGKASSFKWREGPGERIGFTFCYRLAVPGRRVEVRFGLSDSKRLSAGGGPHPFDDAVLRPEILPPVAEGRQLPPLIVGRGLDKRPTYWMYALVGTGLFAFNCMAAYMFHNSFSTVFMLVALALLATSVLGQMFWRWRVISHLQHEDPSKVALTRNSQ